MPFTIIRQDITKMNVDAVVNAANTELLMGSGVCGAIFKKAGAEKLQAECRKLSPIQTGKAVITDGFDLPAKYIIHTAGPVYDSKNEEKCRALLYSSYYESLKLALKNGCESIAFPLISSGIYGYPKDKALKIATDAVSCFLSENDMDVFLAVFDRKAFVLSSDLMGKIDSYIDEKYVDIREDKRRMLCREESIDIDLSRLYTLNKPQSDDFIQYVAEKKPDKEAKDSLDDIIGNMDEPFNETLMKLIDLKGKTDSEVYRKANIDRRLFSKIRSGNGYMPGKKTIIALAIALELDLEETNSLLERAGYTLSHSQKFDVIIEYFIISGIYDIYKINEALFSYDQPLLGSY